MGFLNDTGCKVYPISKSRSPAHQRPNSTSCGLWGAPQTSTAHLPPAQSCPRTQREIDCSLGVLHAGPNYWQKFDVACPCRSIASTLSEGCARWTSTMSRWTYLPSRVSFVLAGMETKAGSRAPIVGKAIEGDEA